MFPPEENVSNGGKGRGPNVVVSDTPFAPSHLSQAGAATGVLILSTSEIHELHVRIERERRNHLFS